MSNQKKITNFFKSDNISSNSNSSKSNSNSKTNPPFTSFLNKSNSSNSSSSSNNNNNTSNNNNYLSPKKSTSSILPQSPKEEKDIEDYIDNLGHTDKSPIKVTNTSKLTSASTSIKKPSGLTSYASIFDISDKKSSSSYSSSKDYHQNTKSKFQPLKFDNTSYNKQPQQQQQKQSSFIQQQQDKLQSYFVQKQQKEELSKSDLFKKYKHLYNKFKMEEELESTQVDSQVDDLPSQYTSKKRSSTVQDSISTFQKKSKSNEGFPTTNQTTTTTTTTSTASSSSTTTLTYDDQDEFDFQPEECAPSTIFLMPSSDDEKFRDTWTSEYVRMPCSKSNVYKSITNSRDPVTMESKSETRYLSKWYLINSVLKSNPINNAEELEAAIKSINPRCDWEFGTLIDFFESEYTETETKDFFNKTLPQVIKLALQLPFLCPKPIPLLSKSIDKEIILSQKQIASLLANAMLCTFPRQGSLNANQHNRYPSINFHTLYSSPSSSTKTSKLKCIFHYFARIVEGMPSGNISFHRQVFDEIDFPDWEKSSTPLKELTTFPTGTIEDDGIGMLQVDFANKVIGGGVLGYGCVQEEIRFVINPELLIARLFTAQIQENETVIITGSERFSAYTGYGDTFQWSGRYNDVTPIDKLGRRMTNIVAMDAIKIKGDPFTQYSPNNIERELNKAFCGFF